MGRLKKFGEESEVKSFRMPKIEDPEERQFFNDSINYCIEQFAWIRHSWNFKDEDDEHYNIFKKNIRNCSRNIRHLLWSFISYYRLQMNTFLRKPRVFSTQNHLLNKILRNVLQMNTILRKSRAFSIQNHFLNKKIRNVL